MRPQSVLDLLWYETKRRPELAMIVANLDNMSDAEISETDVGLPWMRQALLKLKHERPSAEWAAEVLANVVDSHTPDPIGEMRQWIGQPTFIRIGRTQLEVNFGQLVWFNQNGVWVDTIYAPMVDPLLHINTRSCGPISFLGYIEANRARVSLLTPMEQRQPASVVRFYRPP